VSFYWVDLKMGSGNSQSEAHVNPQNMQSMSMIQQALKTPNQMYQQIPNQAIQQNLNYTEQHMPKQTIQQMSNEAVQQAPNFTEQQIPKQAIQQTSNKAIQQARNFTELQTSKQAIQPNYSAQQTSNQLFKQIPSQGVDKTHSRIFITDQLRNQTNKNHISSNRNPLSIQKQSRQEIYQNRPRVKMMQSCSGCSSNIHNTLRTNIEGNKNYSQHVTRCCTKNMCNEAPQICPCSSSKCSIMNKHTYCHNNENNIYTENECNCNSCQSNSIILNKNLCSHSCNFNCNSSINDQNNTYCFSDKNSISNNNRICNKYCMQMDSGCFCDKKNNQEQQIQQEILCCIDQSKVCDCNNCLQNCEQNYSEYFNQNQENPLSSTESESTVVNTYDSNNNRNETTNLHSFSNMSSYNSNDNSYLINQQYNTPLDQNLIYMPPPTNLGNFRELVFKKNTQYGYIR
jgi:hypothetical protein